MESNEKNIWDERIEDYRNSGISLDQWCKLNNVTKSAMNYHLYDRPSRKKKKKEEGQSIKLVPAKIIDMEEAVSDDKGSVLTITVNGVSIEVDRSTDLELLSKVVGALS